MPFELASALRHGAPHAYGASDFTRGWSAGETLLLAIANGYEGPFSSYFPAGSRLALELLGEAWSDARGGLEERARTAVERTRPAFVERAPTLYRFQDEDDRPDAVMLA